MPQLIALALAGAGLYAGYRWFARTAKEITAEIRRSEDELRRRAGRALEKDLGAAGIRSGERRLPAASGTEAAGSIGALELRKHREVLDVERRQPEPVMLGRGGDDGVGYIDPVALVDNAA